MINNILTQRGERYGAYNQNSMWTQATLNKIMHCWTGKYINPNENVADSIIKNTVINIVLKLSRIHNGDKTYTDNYTDIVGYATLTFRALRINVGDIDKIEAFDYELGSYIDKITLCCMKLVISRNALKSKATMQRGVETIVSALVTVIRLSQAEIDGIERDKDDRAAIALSNACR